MAKTHREHVRSRSSKNEVFFFKCASRYRAEFIFGWFGLSWVSIGKLGLSWVSMVNFG